MRELIATGSELQKFCAERGWRSCIIGGIAVQRWGEPRITRDVDISLLAGFGGEATFIDELLRFYRPRQPEAREFALRHRVVLVQTINGIGIDIALAGFPFEENAIERASSYEFLPGLSVTTCSAEDLIIYKAFAERALDWHDVETILVRQGDTLDLGYVYRELTPLCELKEAPEIVPRLKALAQKIATESNR